MSELPRFIVSENCLYRPISQEGIVIKSQVVLTREEFVACYNKWIKEETHNARV